MAARQAGSRRPGTLRDLRTAVSARVRSKPVAEGQRYLDLWTLKRDRARWARAKAQAEERLQTIDKALAKIDLPEQPAPADAPDEPRTVKTINFRTPGARRRRT